MTTQTCPGCGEPALKRRPSNRLTDRLKKLFTSKRPHYCRKCDWTGWLDISEHHRHHQTWTVEREPPDLKAIDAELLADSGYRDRRSEI
jgi:hypothetical protein